MTDILDINTIERGAARQMEVARKTKELATLVDHVFPGYAVFIERRKKSKTTGDSTKGGGLAGLALLDQVETVLSEAKRPMQKRNLLKEIHRRGGTVSENTLSIYLSRYPQFVSRGHGKWSIDRKNGSKNDS